MTADLAARLADLRGRREQLEEETRTTCLEAKAAGMTWQQVADALGIRSRQGAFELAHPRTGRTRH